MPVPSQRIRDPLGPTQAAPCIVVSFQKLPELIGGQTGLPQDALQDNRKDRFTGVVGDGHKSWAVWVAELLMAAGGADVFPPGFSKSRDYLSGGESRQTIWHSNTPSPLCRAAL